MMMMRVCFLCLLSLSCVLPLICDELNVMPVSKIEYWYETMLNRRNGILFVFTTHVQLRYLQIHKIQIESVTNVSRLMPIVRIQYHTYCTIPKRKGERWRCPTRSEVYSLKMTRLTAVWKWNTVLY